MAIILGAPTEAIIDHILRTINAPVLRGQQAQFGQDISLVSPLITLLAGAETFVEVNNIHEWPETGTAQITNTGAGADTIQYVRKTGLRNEYPVSWDGVGNPPRGRLHLAAGTTVANAHTVAAFVGFSTTIAARGMRAMDSGLIGIQDVSGFLKSLRQDLVPVVTFTATGNGAADGTTFVDGAGTFTAGAMVGDTVTGTGGAINGDIAVITGNTATTLTVSPAFGAQSLIGDTLTIAITNMDPELIVLDASLPPNYASTNVRGEADTSITPLGATEHVLDALGHVIDQYGGARPVFTAEANPHGTNIVPQTRLSSPAVAADTILNVLDASVLPQAGGICLIGGAIGNRTVLRNFAGKQGTGPNQIQFTAAMGGGVAAGVVVSVVGATANDGAYSRRTVPFARDFQVEAFLNAAIAAVEAYTLPA